MGRSGQQCVFIFPGRVLLGTGGGEGIRAFSYPGRLLSSFFQIYESGKGSTVDHV